MGPPWSLKFPKCSKCNKCSDICCIRDYQRKKTSSTGRERGELTSLRPSDLLLPRWASHSGCGHSFVIWFKKWCKDLVRRVSSLISFGVNSTSCGWFWQSVSQCIVDFRTFIADNYCVVFHLLNFTLLSITQYFIMLNISHCFVLLNISYCLTFHIPQAECSGWPVAGAASPPPP